MLICINKIYFDEIVIENNRMVSSTKNKHLVKM